MAILFSQADGSDQHYDTYEEFEQAFILLKRLNGEKVPQDLLDEVKAKHGGDKLNSIDLELGGVKFESTVKEATREIAEALDEVAKDRTSESDECENVEKESKYEVGDKVKVVNNLSGGHPEGTVGVIESVNYDWGTFEYEVDPKSGSPYGYTLYHDEEELESAKDSPTEFRDGDLVRVTESFRDSFGDVAGIHSVLTVRIDGTGRVLGVGKVLIGDNHDKLQLVCRKEDRKDISL